MCEQTDAENLELLLQLVSLPLSIDEEHPLRHDPLGCEEDAQAGSGGTRSVNTRVGGG